MRKLRIVAVLVVVCGVVGLGSSAAGAGLSGTRDVTVAVPMTCVGPTTETRTITVSATLPRHVRAGRAYTVTNLTTDVPNGGAVTIAASAGHPAVFAAGSGGSSTIQLVAGTKPGRRIALHVTRADYVLPGTITGDPRPVLIPGVRVSCTPTAPVSLGSIKVVGRGGGHGSGTAGIDVTLGLDTTILDQPFVSNPVRVTATVPTKLHPGDTFTVADLQATVPLVPFTAQFSIVADGADPQAVTAGSAHTVTARPGETVDLRLVAVAYDVSVVASSPISSGHLASIPVVAR
jgi:hypothetical protein